MPFALGRFSTITLWRTASESFGAMRRAMKSGPVPPALAATMRICLGKTGSCAAAWTAASSGARTANAMPREKMIRIPLLLVIDLWFDRKTTLVYSTLPAPGRLIYSAAGTYLRGSAMTEVTSALRSEFAPTGKLRVGLNMSNFLLTAKDAATGEPKGIAADLGRELVKRLGLAVELVPYPGPGVLADDAGKNKWDVGFLGAEPQRANEIDFTGAYVEIEATYLLPGGSPLKSVAEVDRKGARIAVPERSAYELWLTRNIKNADLVRIKGADEAFKEF